MKLLQVVAEIGGEKSVGILGLRLRGRLLLLRQGLGVDAALLADLRKVPVNVRNEAGSSLVDGFQTGPQLFQLFALGPGSDIPEAVFGGLDAVILTDGVGDAFGLHLLGVAVLLDDLRAIFASSGLRLLLFIVMQLGMGDLMDHRADGLHLTHALPDGDGLIRRAEIPVRVRCNRRESNGDGRGPAQGLHENIVLLYAAGEGGRQMRKGLTVRLRHVKHLDRLEHGDADFLFLHDLLAVLVQHRRVGIGVELDFLDLLLEGRGRDDGDAHFSLFHMASELMLPFLKARHQGGVRALHIDEHGVVDAVTVEAAHNGEILPVTVTLKQLLDALFNAVRDLLEPLLVGLGFCHDRFELLSVK